MLENLVREALFFKGIEVREALALRLLSHARTPEMMEMER